MPITWTEDAEAAYEQGLQDGVAKIADSYGPRLPGLSAQQSAVLRIIKALGPSNTKQITAALGRGPKSRGSVNRTLVSLTDYEDDSTGFVEEDTLFDLPLTGQRYDVWKLTKRGRRLLR